MVQYRPLKMAETAAQADSLVLNEASIKASCVGRGISLTTILVTIPNVPSEPIINCVKLYPEAYFKVLAPVQMISPSGKTTSRFNIYSRMVPYFTTLGPPEPCDTFPPIKQLPLLAGATGYSRFYGSNRVHKLLGDHNPAQP